VCGARGVPEVVLHPTPRKTNTWTKPLLWKKNKSEKGKGGTDLPCPDASRILGNGEQEKKTYGSCHQTEKPNWGGGGQATKGIVQRKRAKNVWESHNTDMTRNNKI